MPRKHLKWIVPAFFLLLAVGLRLWDPLPVEVLRLKTFDTYQQIEPREAHQQLVAIVDIDEESLAKLGQWPWPRTVVADLVTTIMDHGALAIALDVVFAEPDRVSPANVADALRGVDESFRTELRNLPSNDLVLANALRGGLVVVGQAGYPQPVGDPDRPIKSIPVATLGADPRPYLTSFEGLVRNIPVLEEAAKGFGIFTVNPETDGIVRRIPAIARVGDMIYPTLSLELLRVATGGKAVVIKTDETGVQGIVIGGAEIPTDRHGRLWVHFSESDPNKYVSARDVLADAVAPERLAGKLVLVGTSAFGLLDIKTTPVESSMPGVEVHAQLLETIFADALLTRPHYALGAEVALMLVLGALVILLLAFRRRLVRRPFMWLAVAAIVVSLIAGSWGLYVSQGLLFDPAYVSVVLILLTLVAAYVAILLKTDWTYEAREFFAEAGYRRTVRASSSVLLLRSIDGRTCAAVGYLGLGSSDDEDALVRIVKSQRESAREGFRTYLLYDDPSIVAAKGAGQAAIQALRQETGSEVVPIWRNILERALETKESKRTLALIEEPFLVRNDPYLESKPINDPTWFYGRRDLLDRFQRLLIQGQHVGLFGLRKVGKTSFINQLHTQLTGIPIVQIDLQSFGVCRASDLFRDVVSGLRAELQRLRVVSLAGPNESPRDEILALIHAWHQVHRIEPFIIVLDEIEHLFPETPSAARSDNLAEYLKFFRVIRGISQSTTGLATLVVGYRPSVNRKNLLDPELGENPMFNFLQEEYLGFLTADESAAMIREIGSWKGIRWDEAAVAEVFDHCGGHPMITRSFASEACERGRVKQVTPERVRETASRIVLTFRKNDIGNYYSEGIWATLRDDERSLLGTLSRDEGHGIDESSLTDNQEQALTNLERFGLIQEREGSWRLSAGLFAHWVRRRSGRN